MTNISKTPYGELQQFFQNLHSGGFTYEDVVRVIREPKLARAMYAAIQPGTTALQTIIPTDIVERVERQLARYEQFGFHFTDYMRWQIRAAAAVYVPISATDRPLVTGCFGYAPEAFNEVVSAVKTNDYEVVRHFDQDVPIQFADGMNPKVTRRRLVHFEPNSYQGDSARSALVQATLDHARLAGIEVAEMLFVEPEWALEWNGKEHPFPYVSALRLNHGTDVPSFNWKGSLRRCLRMHKHLGDQWNSSYSSPTITEC